MPSLPHDEYLALCPSERHSHSCALVTARGAKGQASQRMPEYQAIPLMGLVGTFRTTSGQLPKWQLLHEAEKWVRGDGHAPEPSEGRASRSQEPYGILQIQPPI